MQQMAKAASTGRLRSARSARSSTAGSSTLSWSTLGGESSFDRAVSPSRSLRRRGTRGLALLAQAEHTYATSLASSRKMSMKPPHSPVATSRPPRQRKRFVPRPEGECVCACDKRRRPPTQHLTFTLGRQMSPSLAGAMAPRRHDSGAKPWVALCS